MGQTSEISWTHGTVRPAMSGPKPMLPRDGDKQQARQRINVEVRTGRRLHPNSLPCVDCGHEWAPGERRHEYDHHLGYSPEHHADVQSVCTRCHATRDNLKMRAESCIGGHPYTAENTGRKSTGQRFCRECRKTRDRGRRSAEYWREYRAKRKA